MIDTHTHLYLSDFNGENDLVVRRALDAGVSHLVMPNVDLSTITPMQELHRRFPDETSVAMGLHPTEVGEEWRRDILRIDEELRKGGYVAVGEIGMDLYWDSTYRLQQMEAFHYQLIRAGELSLPVIIHCREALGETLEVIKSASPSTGLIFHSFTGTVDDVRRIREVCDPMFGINGVVTFKNASSLRESLAEIGIDHLLLETDSPYLSPVPNRGKRNESANIPYVCGKIADTLGLTSEEVSAKTDINARSIFSL